MASDSFHPPRKTLVIELLGRAGLVVMMLAVVALVSIITTNKTNIFVLFIIISLIANIIFPFNIYNMKYLNSYNEGLFSDKKIDTTFLNKYKEGLESNNDITDVNLSAQTPRLPGHGSDTTIDATKVTFKYKGKPQEVNLLLKVEDSDTKIGSIFKKTFSKPYLLISSTGWSIDYNSNSENKAEDCVRDTIRQVNHFWERATANDEMQKQRKEKANSFKENLPEETLHDLILNLEDILGEAKIEYNDFYLNWEVTFEKNPLFKVNENNRITGGNYYDSFGRKSGLVMNIASEKLFEIMGELAQLNSSLESFDCKMEFSIEDQLRLLITLNK